MRSRSDPGTIRDGLIAAVKVLPPEEGRPDGRIVHIAD